jgi:hypothetical protein
MEEEPLAENTSNETIEKPKKPRSDKQLAAFEKARAKRVENAKIKKEKIDEIKEKAKSMKLIDEVKLIDKSDNIPNDKPIEKSIIKKNKKKPKTTIIYQDESSDTDEELVIVKSRKEKKKSIDIISDIPKVPIIKFI